MSGTVTLVGAGPGPGLITVKGLRALKQAEVLVYDDLIDSSLPGELPKDCERIYVGKRAGRHSMQQEEINQILIGAARAGKRVVRLKGGDPFVFGRGGEEVLALQTAGIPARVVPGVTSAVAVPEACGIPVTHRKVARSFTVVTGHSADGTGEDFGALAKLKGTLVFLMGLGSIGTIAESLIVCGKDPATPAAILSKGCTPEQTRIDGTLADIAYKASLAETPAILVVGDTAGMDCAGTIRPPLEGVSVAVTGTEQFTGKLAAQLLNLGARVIRLPLLTIHPNPSAVPEDLGIYTWLVFTSGNGIEVFFDCLRARAVDLRRLAHLRFACVGPGTADRLRKYGFTADFVPSDHCAEGLGRELIPVLDSGDRLLLLRAENGAKELPEALLRANIPFLDAPLYTAQAEELPEVTSEPSDYIVFSSASGVDAFFRSGRVLRGARPVCIGEKTRKQLQIYQDAPVLVPEGHSGEAIIQVILEEQSHETI
ncbi:MAG: uroporphyrinogen-III C-methyltransferase [Oscillospiraceae bacterium]|nr:uroporphyrinogen-III C-methyltransferase [Oscillospiraceae bacterium]